MATERNFELKGTQELRRTLEKIARQVPQEFAGALYRQAQFVMGDAREKHVPVDDTPLQASGEVELPKIVGTDISVAMKFGGPTAPYAVAMHEHPSSASPPSWKDKKLHFTKAGTGHKFLEKPLRRRGKTMVADIAADIDIGRFA